MHDNLQRAIDLVLMDEGGFAKRDAEPGGAVNKGVSLLVFKEWRKRQGKPEPNIDDLRAMSTAEATEIYTELYATPVWFDALPSGLDYVMFDTAVMNGVRGAILLLQSALGIPMTGIYDTKTFETLAATDPKITAFMVLVKAMNTKLHSISRDKYGPGWGDRIVRVANRARDMMKNDLAAKRQI